MNRFITRHLAQYLFKLAREILRKASGRAEQPTLGPGTDMVKCPRCYIYVPAGGSIKTTINGYAVNFCSRECFEAYRRDHQDIDAVPLN